MVPATPGRDCAARCSRAVSLKKPLPPVNSLDDVKAHMREIKWKRDMLPQLFDCVSYPHRVWAKKKDDCDGFSVLAAELLSRCLPETDPVMVTAMVAPLKNSHSVCAFKLDGNLRYFNNATLKPELFQSYADIVADFTGPPNRLICWDVVRPCNLETLEFHTI
jgi:hypothetical protein